MIMVYINRFYKIILIFLAFNSCTLGYKKLTTKKLERKEKRGKVELVKYEKLPAPVSDTIAKEYKKYYEINKGKKEAEYFVTHFITFDSAVKGKNIKYQDFNSSKLRLPFGYFFSFGEKKFFIPYGEQKIGSMFIYFQNYLYFYGEFYGEHRDFDKMKVDSPERWRVDYENCAYWKIEL